MTRLVAEPEEVLAFWYPPGLDADLETHSRQFDWWFRGGGDGEIRARFVLAGEAAAGGALDHWADAPRTLLALIIVLDQFSRTIHRGTPDAYAQDEKAQALALEGLDRGHYERLPEVWQKLFFSMPLSHSERLDLNERNVALCAALVDAARADLRPIYAFGLSQARGHRDVVARFGRHPHRNALLGRASTDEERAYVAAGDFVHQRSFRP